jgi:tetratricopeptide (TPR) repeat protein
VAAEQPKATKETTAAPPAPTGPLRWRDNWQAPALLVAGMALLGGVGMALFNAPKPDFASMMAHGETLIRDEQFVDALAHLNQKVAPYVAVGDVPMDLVQQFHRLRARAVYLDQKLLGHSDPKNLEQIVEEYLQCERAGATLPDEDVFFLADTYIDQGEFDRAMSRRASMPESAHERKNQVIRRIVDRKLNERRSDHEATLELISEYLADPMLEDRDRAWALARQAELLMRQGFVDRSITLLVQGMIRFREVEPELLGELHYILGQAYLESGAAIDAGEQLRLADERFPEGDVRRAEVLVMRAKIESARGDSDGNALAEAVRMYEAVLHDYPTSTAVLPALLGLGEAAAARAETDAALESYTRLIEALKSGKSHPDVTVDDVVHQLLTHWRERYESADIGGALQYAWVAESALQRAAQPHGAAADEHDSGDAHTVTAVAGRGEAQAHGDEHGDAPSKAGHGEPAAQHGPKNAHAAAGGDAHGADHASIAGEVDLAIAKCRRAQADGLLADVGQGEGTNSRVLALAAVDPATREEARRYYIEAGRYYRKHADAMALKDNAAFGDSLWAAADSFDRAGDQETAIPIFAEYIKGFSGDPRLAEATFRLAQAYQGRGDYDMAARFYQSLLRADEGEGADPGVSAYADLSRVPLAQTYLMDGNPTNDDQAEELLEQVIDGKVGGPDTAEYRGALAQLASRVRSRGDLPRAVDLLEECLVRTGRLPEADGVRYDLADVHRQSALAIRDQLDDALPDHQRQALTKKRLSHLKRAMELYEQSRASLDARDPRHLGTIDRLRARNSGFFAADCAYELGDYIAAVQLYEAARERYPSDPASLVSMVQVVNSYIKLGDLRRAKTANDRARRFYESLPAETWADPDLPMSQEHWKSWLNANTALLSEQGAGRSTASGDRGVGGEGPGGSGR